MPKGLYPNSAKMDNKILLQHLTDALASRAGITKRKADAFVRAFFELAEEGLTTEAFLKIKGFATFKIITVSDRESVNINTGERFQINGHEKINFTPDSTFKDLVNRPFNHFTTINLEEDLDISELAEADTLVPNLPDDATANASGTDDSALLEEPEALEIVQEVHPILVSEERQESSSSTDEASADIISEETLDTGEKEDSQSSCVVEPGMPAGEAGHGYATGEDSAEEPATFGETGDTNGRNQEGQDSAEAMVVMADGGGNADGTEEATPATVAGSFPDENCDDENCDTPDHAAIAFPKEDERSDTLSDASSDKEGQEAAITKELQEPGSAQPANGSDSHSIVINNTMPTPTHNRWRTAFMVLTILVLMTLSYYAGYYRLLCPCYGDFLFSSPTLSEEPSGATPAPAKGQSAATKQTATSSKPVPTPAQTATEAGKEEPVPQDKPTAKPAKEEAKPISPAEEAKKAELAAAKKYRQMSGPYLITGVVRVHTMKAGDNLYLLAKKEYGNKEMVSYIIFHNQISNPDLIRLGQQIEIPRLTPKE